MTATRDLLRVSFPVPVLVGLTLLVAGCGGGGFRAPIRNPGDALSGSDRAERIELGAIDADLATDPAQEVARLRRIAALELRVGNHGIAIEATLRALHIARAYAALAPPSERGNAASLHVQMQSEALATAERAGSLELALEAIGRDDPGAAREVIARLVRARADAGGTLAGLTLAEPLARVLDDATRLDFERLGAELPGEPLSIERLGRLGLRALPRLHHLLATAARRQDATRVGELARAIRALDRWDPVARTIGHLEEAQLLDLAIDVVGTAAPSSRGVAIARLERVRRADPQNAAIALALAAYCREIHLDGDALQNAREAVALAQNDEQRRTAELIAALAQGIDGDGTAIANWELANDHDRRSIAIANALAPMRSMAGASDSLRARASAAVRLLVREGVGDPSLAFEIASDRAISDDERQHALDALWVADRAAARIAAQCASERAERAACDARLDLLGETVWWEDFVPEGPVPDLEETAIPMFDVAVRDANVAAVSAWMESAASRRLALTPAWIRARVVLAGRRGDVAGARAVLASEGALLSAASRVVLGTWLGDLEARYPVRLEDLSVALGLGPAVTRFATPPLDQALLEVTEIHADTERFVAADSHLAYDTWRADAPARLLPLLERATDRDGAVIAGWMGAAVDRDVRERGDSASALTQIAARAHELAPGTAVDLLLEALRMGDESGPRVARDAFTRALVLDPSSRALQMRWLEAWSEGDPFAPADEARARLLAIDPMGLPHAVATGSATSIGELLALYGVDFPERHPDVIVSAGPRVARVTGAWPAIRAALRSRVAQGPDADPGAASPATLLPIVDAAAPCAERRRWLVRLRILTSDMAGALAAADAPESDDAEPGTDSPLAPDDRLRALALARTELPDALAWELVAEDELGDDPDTLERLRARAIGHPELDALLCGELARSYGFTPATMQTCARTWRNEPGATSATVLSRTFMEAPSSAWVRVLSPSTFFDEVRQALGSRTPCAVLHQESLVLERHGDRDPAVAAEIEAEARGCLPAAWGADGPRLRGGLVVRAQRARPVAPRWTELALLALGDARLVAAQLYADAAVAGVRGRASSDASTDLAFAARDFVGWASSDLAAGHIDAAGIEAFEQARARGLPDSETASLASAHPESSLVAYAATVRAIRAGQDDDALHWADVGLREQARPTLVSAIAPVVDEVRGHAETEALRARARAAYPDDPRIERAAADPVPAADSVRASTVVATGTIQGCSLTTELAAAGSDIARAALLRDAFRTAADESERRRVLACAGSTSALTSAAAAMPAATTAATETVASAEAPTAEHAASPAAERRRLAEEAELAAQRAEEESRHRTEEANRAALEAEQRARAADASRAQAEQRLAEAERRAAEAERRALETRPSAAAAEPTAVATSDAEQRAADAERRVADAERRASEADARAALAERTAIEEMRRIAAASRAAETATPTTPPPPPTTPTTVSEPTTQVPVVAAVPASEPTTQPAPLTPSPVAADAGVAPVADAPVTTPPITETAIATAPAPTSPESAPSEAPTASSATAATPPDAGVAAAPPAETNILYSPELPPPNAAELAARAAALAAEADQRVAMSESRVAVAAARASQEDELATEAGPRASQAEVRAVEGEHRVVEAETRAAEAERRAADASHRLEATLRDAAPLPPRLVAPGTAPEPAVVATSEAVGPAVVTADAPTPAATSEAAPSHMGALGVAAELDADPDSYRRGIALALLDPEGALVAAREIVQAPARPTPAAGDTLPPFGTVQALVGLPPQPRRQLAAEMMSGSDRQQRLLALAAEQVAPDTVDVDAIRRTIEADDAGLAIEAVRAHGLRAHAVELDAMRARLDAMHPPLAAQDRDLAAAIVHVLAGAVDARDRVRLAGASELVVSGVQEEQQAAAARTASAVEHDAALYLAARGRGPIRDPNLAPEAERIRRAHQPSLPSAAAVRLLSTEPLPRVLTGTNWRYVRVAQPGSLVSAMTGATIDPAIAHAASAWLDAHGGSELGPEGGLDPSQPIECALADSGPRSWVCTAHVLDRDRLRTSLARRPLGGHSGVWIALGAGDLARGLPVLAGATPITLDRILAGETIGDRGTLAFAERARADVDLGGVVVERYTTIERRDDRATDIDSELYLFTGDRVVVFGDEEMARTIVATPPSATRSLARSPRFRRVTAGWSDGPTLQMAVLDWRAGGEMPLVVRRDASTVVGADAGGLVVTTRAPFTEPRRDVLPLAAMLPDDAIARFALAVNAPRATPPRRGRAPATPALAHHDEVARLLVREAERIAFAWTPRAGDALWDRWVAIVEGRRVEAALAAAGVTGVPADGTIHNVADTFFARRGTRWLIAPVEEDLRAALARPDVAADPRATALGSGRLDGGRGSRAALDLEAALAPGDPRRAALDAIGAEIGASGELSFDARIEARQLVLVTRVRPSAP